jgi:hypothetical protein
MDDKVKAQIIDLLNKKEPDYDTACQLIMQHNTNKSEVRVYIASPKRYYMQMRWVLAKLIGIKLADFQKGIFDDFRKQNTEDLPAIIIRIKEELPQLYEQRAMVQKELTELGDANDEETKAKAQKFGELAEMLGIRHQLLQEAKEAYFDSKGEIIPDEKELFPEEETEEDADTPLSTKYDWEGDPLKAVTAQKNIAINLTKDRNRLKYQSPSAKDKKENPMPEGPERDKIEARIASREKEMEAIAVFLNPKDDTDKA